MLLCPNVDEIKIAHHSLAVNGVCHEAAVNAPDAHGGNGTREGNIGNTERRARRVHKENIRIVLAVCAENDADNLGVVEVTLREKRTKRAIRHPAGEDFFLGRATLPLEITARKFSDSTPPSRGSRL